jgi:hypothetical protein
LGKTYFCFKLHRYHHDTRYFMTFIVLLFILFYFQKFLEDDSDSHISQSILN